MWEQLLPFTTDLQPHLAQGCKKQEGGSRVTKVRPQIGECDMP